VSVLAPVPDLSGLSLSTMKRTVGLSTFERGEGYARAERVLSLEWDVDEYLLHASVAGHGAIYETCAWFDEDETGAIFFVEGECSCPVGYDCKHVAAVVIAAASSDAGRTVEARRPARRQPASHALPGPGTADWELPLRALAAARGLPAVGVPLAIELKLAAPGYPDNGAPRLVARIMRPGARGGWVNGSLNWCAPHDGWQLRNAGHRDDHIALVQELYALHQLSEARSSYYSSYPSERAIDLSACESPHLWTLLERAARLELPLIHSGSELGEVRLLDGGELVLDVTCAGPPGWSVTVGLHVAGKPADELVPVRFIGREARGLVCAERSDLDAGMAPERWRLRLVRLTRPAAAQLERMLLGGERLAIPEAAIERFGEELCPALRHIAPVISSDGSFEPPPVSEPSLVLQARYGSGTEVEVGWAWAYQVGASSRREPLAFDERAAGFRDPDAERALLRTAALRDTGLDRLGLLDDEGRPLASPPTALPGVGGLVLSTQVLPGLAELPGLAVEIAGEPPAYRDVSDSLSIGVSTGEIAGDRDWFDLGVTISIDGREVPFADVFTALALDQPWLLLDDGAYFSLADPRLGALARLIEEARAIVEVPLGELRISRYQADVWSELVGLGVVTEQTGRWQRVVTPLLKLDGLPDYEEPGGLHADLRPYQRDGFVWLAALWDLELGGILADDMGLGKTVQALALICHARERDPEVGPFLVVAPTSVAPNWATEAGRFAPELRVEPALDTLARSGRMIGDVATADVVVTTYNLFRLDFEAYRTVPWAGLLLDEAQYVKNHRGKTYRCARELDAPFKLAITGTPMENNLMELWAMLSIAAPGLFPDPQRFTEHYARPIERRADAERLARLRRRIKPLVKRRTKELVAAELPPKQEQTLAVELHSRHRKLYDTHLQRERAKVLALLDDFDRNRFTILTSITRLRQLSLHPRLVDDRHRTVSCAKLDALVDQLADVISSGHRALVFSQFTQFLAAVRERLDSEQISHCYLDGATRKRDRVIDRFRSGEDPVFLISLKAGGVGLNLVEADYCFLLDPWWNPATETQAIDRAHRIGQTRQVMVYRLISTGTIEEKVRALAERKAELFHGVLDDGDLFSRGLTAEDIRGLLE
jgi:superfamily II DNA or RNA helicase